MATRAQVLKLLELGRSYETHVIDWVREGARRDLRAGA